MEFEALKQIGQSISQMINPVTTQDANTSTNPVADEETTPQTQVQPKEETQDESLVVKPGEQKIPDDLLEHLQKTAKAKDVLEEDKPSTFDELFPSMKENINKGNVSGAGMSMPIYAASLLYPYALLDKRVNAQLRQAKMKQLYADKITLTAPKTLYNLQPDLSKNFYDDMTSIVNEEKAKGGNWYQRLKDPNSTLNKKVRDYKEYAQEWEDDKAQALSLDKLMKDPNKAKDFWMSNETKDAVSQFYKGTEMFGEDPEKMPIDKMRDLSAKMHVSLAYSYLLNDALKGQKEDIDNYYNGELANMPTNLTAEQQVDWHNRVVLQSQKKFLNPDTAEEMATNFMQAHPEVVQGEMKYHNNLSDEEIHEKIKKDFMEKMGVQYHDVMDKITTPQWHDPKTSGSGNGGVTTPINPEDDTDIINGQPSKKWDLTGANKGKGMQVNVNTAEKGQIVMTYMIGGAQKVEVLNDVIIPPGTYYADTYEEQMGDDGKLGGSVYISNTAIDGMIQKALPAGATLVSTRGKVNYSTVASGISNIPLNGDSRKQMVAPQYQQKTQQQNNSYTNSKTVKDSNGNTITIGVKDGKWYNTQTGEEIK